MPSDICNSSLPAPWSAAIDAALAQREAWRTLRRRRAVRVIDSTHVERDGRTLINFSSNDYLGLAHHPRVRAAFAAAAQRSAGSGAAALITGYTATHASAEAAIARWKQTPSAVLLGSGYLANLATVQALAAIGSEHPGGVRFLLDKLAHASLIDAVRGVCRGDTGSACFRVFPHNHMAKLQRLLADAPADQLQVVVTESIFSMDGDAADLPTLADLKRRHRFLLLLDEAHGSGVYGQAGRGYADEAGFAALADITVATLSKAVGVAGGAVCGAASLCEAVVNFGRAYVYSTHLPAAVAAAVEEAIATMGDEPHRQRRVRQLATSIRQQLSAMGFALAAGDSPIIPILLRDEQTSLAAAQRLEQHGLLVTAIRPPTVPRGTSRLRITLSSEHTDAEAGRLLECLAQLRPQIPT